MAKTTEALEKELAQVKKDFEQLAADTSRSTGNLNKIKELDNEVKQLRSDNNQMIRDLAALKERLQKELDKLPGIVGVNIKLPPAVVELHERVQKIVSTIPS